jgi:hypothetical protein
MKKGVFWHDNFVRCACENVQPLSGSYGTRTLRLHESLHATGFAREHCIWHGPWIVLNPLTVALGDLLPPQH